MAVNNDLAVPDTESKFEEMCHQLYRLVWDDATCMRVGRDGQDQCGVDILGHDGKRSVGIQCKHYVKTKFSYSTVMNDLKKVEGASLHLDHLLFATTAPSDTGLVLQVHKLNLVRKERGQFTVSIDFWREICSHINNNPSIGRDFIQGYPGGLIPEIESTTKKTLAAVESLAENSLTHSSIQKIPQTLAKPDFRISQKGFSNIAGKVTCELEIYNQGGRLNSVKVDVLASTHEFPAINRGGKLSFKISITWPHYEFHLSVKGYDDNGSDFEKTYFGIYRSQKFEFD